jgi:hypothetical protein
MITFTRTDDGWTGTNPSKADPTDRERLRDLPPEERKAAFNAIRERATVAVDNEAELEALYDLHRPDTTDGDDYQLIAMDVIEDRTGILNCRVNGEHVQIRF